MKWEPTRLRHQRRRTQTKFTLIELLVVIAIIAILAAMLMPALSRARYSAKLVVCINNQKQVAIGLTAGATDNDGNYPDRTANFDNNVSPHPSNGYAAPFSLAFNGGNVHDDRPVFADLFPINEMDCPMTPNMNLTDSTANHVRWSYALYGGWQLHHGQAMMKRPEDVMTQGGNEFDILVADQNTTYASGNVHAAASHSDYGTGSMELNVFDSDNLTFSHYRLSDSYGRGPIDLNFTRTDGSAFRISKVTVDDDRLEKVNYKCNNGGDSLSDRWSLLPSTDF